MKKQTMIAFALMALVLSSCLTQEINRDDDTEGADIRILFIGNSLTYSNDLPALIVKEGLKRDIVVKTEMIAYPNYALEDHWNDGQIQGRIKKGGFDYVVVQQGPSSQSDGRQMLLSYGIKIDEICEQANAKLVFYMVWPAKVNLYTFEGVIANYRNAAEQTESILCPVGEVWKNHFESTGDYSYYSADEFHPSLKGSQVAAQIIADSLLSE